MSSSLRCLALLLFVSAAAPGELAPRPRPLLLLRGNAHGHKQDVSGPLLAQMLLGDLLKMENEALEEEKVPLEDGEPQDVHVDLERAAAAAGSGLMLAPRERKAGCKNFFWKTFTSC